MQKSSGVLGTRAALALGYYDYNRAHYPEAAKWLARAKSDPLLERLRAVLERGNEYRFEPQRGRAGAARASFAKNLQTR